MYNSFVEKENYNEILKFIYLQNSRENKLFDIEFIDTFVNS